MLPCQRDAFALPDGVHYLNCAYMAPLARTVEAAGIEGMRRKRVPSQILPDAFFADSHRARQLFGRLIQAPAERIALIPSASYGLSTVARNVRVERGANIVIAHEQFPSNVYPWRRLVAEAGAELRTVRPPEVFPRGAAWNHRLLDAIDPHTALVALPPVHWTDGTRFDLEAIGRRAREVGALFVVDGTQSVGAQPFDVARAQPDALICAGYKWLLGPYSLGVAYFGPAFDDGIPIEENWITRRGSEVFGGLVHYTDAYQPGAVRYDVGERSNFILLPMLVAALELLHTWGVADIQAYGAALLGDVAADARALGFLIEEDAWRCGHLLGLRLPPHLSMDRLRAALDARGVSVSLRGDALRVAPHVYNDAADLGALREALAAGSRAETFQGVSS